MLLYVPVGPKLSSVTFGLEKLVSQIKKLSSAIGPVCGTKP